MEFLNEYNLPIIFGICLCIGYIVKHVITTDKINKFIPMIVGILGVVINVWVNEWSLTPEILLAGLFSGLASTGMHQVFKQFIEKKNLAVLVENKTE